MTRLAFRLCPADLRQQALQLALRTMAPEQAAPLAASLERLADKGINVFATLWVAVADDQLVGATWVQPMAGKVATLWLPQFVEEATSDDAKQLASGALDASRQLPIDVIQTLIDPAAGAEGQLLTDLGFQSLATLQFLHWEIASAKKAVAEVDARLTLVPRAGDDPALLKQMLADSYVETLDCPRLDGVRQLADTIEGYQSVGEYRPELWSIVKWQGEPAGVLLVSPYREADHWELVYMGLAPRFRGLGLGRQLLEAVRREGRAAGAAQILLAVDMANWPARRIYNEVGFVEWGTRTAYIRSLKRGLAADSDVSSQGL